MNDLLRTEFHRKFMARFIKVRYVTFSSSRSGSRLTALYFLSSNTIPLLYIHCALFNASVILFNQRQKHLHRACNPKRSFIQLQSTNALSFNSPKRRIIASVLYSTTGQISSLALNVFYILWLSRPPFELHIGQ